MKKQMKIRDKDNRGDSVINLSKGVRVYYLSFLFGFISILLKFNYLFAKAPLAIIYRIFQTVHQVGGKGRFKIRERRESGGRQPKCLRKCANTREHHVFNRMGTWSVFSPHVYLSAQYFIVVKWEFVYFL